MNVRLIVPPGVVLVPFRDIFSGNSQRIEEIVFALVDCYTDLSNMKDRAGLGRQTLF